MVRGYQSRQRGLRARPSVLRRAGTAHLQNPRNQLQAGRELWNQPAESRRQRVQPYAREEQQQGLTGRLRPVDTESAAARRGYADVVAQPGQWSEQGVCRQRGRLRILLVRSYA